MVPKQCIAHTYSTLIKAYGRLGKVQLAWRIFDEASGGGKNAMSDQVYVQMVDVLACNGRHTEALSLLGDMRTAGPSAGHVPSAQAVSIAYASVVRGFVQSRDCAKAVECYEEIRLHGIKVSLVTFNTLVDACCRVGDMESAARLYRDMLDAECQPDLITYSTLVKGYCVRGELDEAMELFALMQQKGIAFDAIVYNSLLDGCARAQKLQCCEELVASMERSGVAPSNHSVSILIKLYGRLKDLDKAFEVWSTLPKKYGFKPNAAVYTCLMSACIANGRTDLAMDLRRQMTSEGVRPDDRTFATLLRGGLRAANAEMCATLAHEALDAGGMQYLNQETAESILALIKRQNLWDAYGRKLQSHLTRRRGRQSHMPSGRRDAEGGVTRTSSRPHDGGEMCGPSGRKCSNICGWT